MTASPVDAGRARDRVVCRGCRTCLRPANTGDIDRLRRFLEHVSQRSRYLRFHGLAVPGNLPRRWSRPDWDEYGVLVADHEGAIVGLGEYARLPDRKRAEVAFLVADEFQHEGIGGLLLAQLAVEARARDIDVFEALVLADDIPMLRVFDEAGFSETARHVGGEVEVQLVLNPARVSSSSLSLAD